MPDVPPAETGAAPSHSRPSRVSPDTPPNPPLRTVIVGLDDFWPNILASGLDERWPDELSSLRLRQGAGPLSIPGFLAALLGADLVVRVGATFRWNSRLDRFLLSLPRRRRPIPLVIYWTGTDVLLLTRSLAEGTAPPHALASLAAARHITGAEHLTHELAEAGITATTVPFPAMALTPPESAPELPSRFRVLSYLPDGSGERFAFYGGPQLLTAARALPQIEFAVMGPTAIPPGEAGADELPANVVLLGRVDDPAPEYAASTAIVRMVEHDAIGGTVCEGLMYGRHVIYTYEVPHTVRVPFGDSSGLIEALRSLYDRHVTGTLELNEAGFEYAATEFDPDLRFTRLREVLLDAAQGRALARARNS